MRKMQIVIATGNEGKIKEFRKMLQDFPVELLGLNDFGPIPEVVEDGDTFDDNAYKKASFTAKVLGIPAISDDSGLVVDALEGAPGVRSARYAGEDATDQQNIDKLLKNMDGIENRKAAFECVVSIAVPSGPALTYEGRCEGEITVVPDGEDGFGYDPVFLCPKYGKTFANCTMDEKNKVSHRGMALSEVVSEFDKILKWLQDRVQEVKPEKPDHKQFEHNDWSEEKMIK